MWLRPAVIAPIQPLAWEFTYASGAALKRRQKKKKKEEEGKGEEEDKDNEFMALTQEKRKSKNLKEHLGVFLSKD